jgi:hypothetical protein
MDTVKLTVAEILNASEGINAILKAKVKNGKLAMKLGMQRAILAPYITEYEELRKQAVSEFATDGEIKINTDEYDQFITRLEDAQDAEMSVKSVGFGIDDFNGDEDKVGEAYATLLPFVTDYEKEFKELSIASRETLKKARETSRKARAEAAEKRKQGN